MRGLMGRLAVQELWNKDVKVNTYHTSSNDFDTMIKIGRTSNANGYDLWIDVRKILIVSETREYDHLLKETDNIINHSNNRG